MYVSVVFNTEYMKVESRIRWFLKSAYLAMRDDCLVITHEYLKSHIEELLKKCGKGVFAEYDIPEISSDDVRKLDICYIPDSCFDEILYCEGSQTKMLLNLCSKRNEKIEKIMIDAIESKLARKKEKLDFIFNSLHVIASVNYLGEYFNAPIIPYVFSAVRKAHGYNQTLYMAHLDNTLFNSQAAKKMYEDYNPDFVPYLILDKREILALLGKNRNLPLIPLIQSEGKYEMGVIGDCFRLTPQVYQYEKIVDDDLYCEASKYYSMESIISRMHPTQMDQIGITRKHMKNDPASFILSTKRVTTIQSQMILKGALWNRVPCVLGNELPFAFLFTRDFQSNEPLSDSDLNFILFCYLVPDSCMFDCNYWLWRLSNPSSYEIIKRHLEAIINDLGYNHNLLSDKNSRFEHILSSRGLDEKTIMSICSFSEFNAINYDFLSSRLRVTYKDGTLKDYYTLNLFNEDTLTSNFILVNSRDIESIQVFLFDDGDGFSKILFASYGNDLIDFDSDEVYWPKTVSKWSFNIGALAEQNEDNVVFKIVWKAKKFE